MWSLILLSIVSFSAPPDTNSTLTEVEKKLRDEVSALSLEIEKTKASILASQNELKAQKKEREAERNARKDYKWVWLLGKLSGEVPELQKLDDDVERAKASAVSASSGAFLLAAPYLFSLVKNAVWKKKQEDGQPEPKKCSKTLAILAAAGLTIGGAGLLVPSIEGLNLDYKKFVERQKERDQEADEKVEKKIEALQVKLLELTATRERKLAELATSKNAADAGKDVAIDAAKTAIKEKELTDAELANKFWEENRNDFAKAKAEDFASSLMARKGTIISGAVAKSTKGTQKADMAHAFSKNTNLLSSTIEEQMKGVVLKKYLKDGAKDAKTAFNFSELEKKEILQESFNQFVPFVLPTGVELAKAKNHLSDDELKELLKLMEKR